MKTAGALLAVLLPAAAAACPVCFGQDQDQAGLGAAFNLGITLMLGITFSLLAGGIVWFARIEKRRQALDARYFDLIGAAGRERVPHA